MQENLFYTQLHLTKLAHQATQETMNSILDKYSTFYAVQSSLYFPLILSNLFYYIIIFFLFPASYRINRIIRIVMGINIIRSL